MRIIVSLLILNSRQIVNNLHDAFDRKAFASHAFMSTIISDNASNNNGEDYETEFGTNLSREKNLYSISVVIPAYNEEERIPSTLMTYVAYLKHRFEDFEVVVVDDGSHDDTVGAVKKLAHDLSLSFKQFSIQDIDNAFEDDSCACVLRCLTLPTNVGKGKALSSGIRFTKESSRFILVADADGSADISSLEIMVNTSACEASPNIVVGRRCQESISLKRLILRLGFKWTVQILCFPSYLGSDTQCGFKVFPRKYALNLYNQLHLDGWSHDVEVLYLASMAGLNILENDVTWKDVPGSKLIETSVLDVVAISLRMLLEVFYMRLMYSIGQWKPDLEFSKSDRQS